MLDYKKYGYEIILNGNIMPNKYNAFVMEKFDILKKDDKLFFSKYNHGLILKLQSMGCEVMDVDILNKIEPFGHYHELILEGVDGFGKFMRNLKIDKLLKND